MEIQLGNVGQIIQLAVAPVFLLTGVGTNLAVLTNRLGRIIDRSRVLEDRIHGAATSDHSEAYVELETLYRRANLINRAITLSTACALLVCLVVAALFMGGAMKITLSRLIALMFVLAMFSLIGSFICLMREVFIATRTMSVRRRLTPRH